MKNCFILIFMLSLIIATKDTLVFAQNQNNAQEIEKNSHIVSSSILSPFCPGRTLNDCPSSAASELKTKISDWLAQGRSNDEILQELYQTYGEEFRALPKKEGFGLVAWLTPGAFLLGGFAILSAWLLSHKSQAEKKNKIPALDAETQARIDRELAK